MDNSTDAEHWTACTGNSRAKRKRNVKGGAEEVGCYALWKPREGAWVGAGGDDRAEPWCAQMKESKDSSKGALSGTQFRGSEGHVSGMTRKGCIKSQEILEMNSLG